MGVAGWSFESSLGYCARLPVARDPLSEPSAREPGGGPCAGALRAVAGAAVAGNCARVAAFRRR